VLGVFRSHDELLTGVAALLVERQFSFSVDEDSEDDDYDYVTFDADEHQLELKPLPELDDPTDDLDRNATSEIVIVAPDGALQHTGFYVWDSEQKWAAYAPLKLLVHHPGRQRRLVHHRSHPDPSRPPPRARGRLR